MGSSRQRRHGLGRAHHDACNLTSHLLGGRNSRCRRGKSPSDFPSVVTCPVYTNRGCSHPERSTRLLPRVSASCLPMTVMVCESRRSAQSEPLLWDATFGDAQCKWRCGAVGGAVGGMLDRQLNSTAMITDERSDVGPHNNSKI
jgi:hypothetical protein